MTESMLIDELLTYKELVMFFISSPPEEKGTKITKPNRVNECVGCRFYFL